MASDRQIQANRENAQLSTGPRSPEGKQRVASNALKHGLTGKQIVLPNEEADEFDAFRSALWADLDPRGVLEEVLVDKIVADAWRLRRVPILEAVTHARVQEDGKMESLSLKITRIHQVADADSRQYQADLKRVHPSDKAEFDRLENDLKEAQIKAVAPSFIVTRVLESHARQFENLSRREEALTKSMLRGLHELERLQRRRAGESVPAPAALDVEVNVNQNGGDGSAL